jgi:Galactose oxidase, central domain/Secretion system C-terminal sorting domain
MKRKLAIASVFTISVVHAQVWEQLVDFPGTARDDAAAFSHNCKVYVGTGLEVGWTPTNDWWRYDMIQFSWQQVASLPSTPRQYCTAHTINGIGYLFGGLDANAPLNELWAYDTSNDSWTAKAPLPGTGRYACASFEFNARLYIYGGLVADGTALGELWEYDPITDQWTQRTDLPGVARHRATAISPSAWVGYPMVAGGADAAYTPLDEVWQYGPGDTWTQLASLPEARYGLSSSAVPGAIVIAGAIDNTIFRADGFQYDPGGDSWEPLAAGPIPDGRRGGAMGWSHTCSGWFFSFFGLGLDNSATRRNDWYGTGFLFGMEEVGPFELPLYPDPTTDHINLGFDPADGPAYVSVIDATGKIVQSFSSLQMNTVDIADLDGGAYTVVLKQLDQERIARFIKLP